MARDGSGNYSRVVTPPTNGDVADADDFNAEINDIASEITASLEKSGKATWTGNQNANGFGVRSLANTKVHTTAGGTTTYTVTTGASFTSYANLPLIFVKANATNTGSMTINVDSIGALTVKKNGATNLASGDFVQDYIYALAYDGTNLQLIGGTLAAGFQPLDATLTALAALSTSASQYIRATGTDAFTMDSYATVLSNIGAQASLGYTAANDSLVVKLAGTQTLTGQKTMSGADFVLDTAVGPTGAASAGFRGAPVNEQNGNYTLVLADAGKTIFHENAGTHTLTIPANASVAFPLGTVIILINSAGSGNYTVSITTDTLRRGDGVAGTGSRTMAANSVCTIVKVKATEWYISGVFT